MMHLILVIAVVIILAASYLLTFALCRAATRRDMLGARWREEAWATMNAIPDGKPGAVLIVRAEPRTRAFQATVAALDEAGTPRFDAVVYKRQDIKAGMGHSPDKLHEYPQVLGEIVEAMGARA